MEKGFQESGERNVQRKGFFLLHQWTFFCLQSHLRSKDVALNQIVTGSMTVSGTFYKNKPANHKRKLSLDWLEQQSKWQVLEKAREQPARVYFWGIISVECHGKQNLHSKRAFSKILLNEIHRNVMETETPNEMQLFYRSDLLAVCAYRNLGQDSRSCSVCSVVWLPRCDPGQMSLLSSDFCTSLGFGLALAQYRSVFLKGICYLVHIGNPTPLNGDNVDTCHHGAHRTGTHQF